MSDAKTDGIVIDFIDPLFAVVLHISFVERVMREPWYTNLNVIFEAPHLFQAGTLFLAYVTIVNSWIGYHQSIKKSPIDVNKNWGMFRFALDIVLLFFYAVLVTNYDHFRRELFVLVIIFFIFFLWDQAKAAETGTSLDSSARRGVTFVWLLVFLFFFGIYSVVICIPCLSNLRSSLGPIILVAAITSNFLYRLHKGYLKPRRLLLFLGLHDLYAKPRCEGIVDGCF
jgi:hypothetical protein